MELFHQHFPDIAKKEIRSAHLMGGPGPGGLPAGEYALFEAYCTEPNCDCRRVMLNVVHKDMGIVAVIGFGFDPDGPMAAPMLDPLNRQSQYAELVLDLVVNVVLRDPAYVARLERHYRLMKDKFDTIPNSGAPAPKPRNTWSQPAEERWWKRKRRKPRR